MQIPFPSPLSFLPQCRYRPLHFAASLHIPLRSYRTQHRKMCTADIFRCSASCHTHIHISCHCRPACDSSQMRRMPPCSSSYPSSEPMPHTLVSCWTAQEISPTEMPLSFSFYLLFFFLIPITLSLHAAHITHIACQLSAQKKLDLRSIRIDPTFSYLQLAAILQAL